MSECTTLSTVFFVQAIGGPVAVDHDSLRLVVGVRWRIISNRSGNVYARGKMNGKWALMHRVILGVQNDPTKYVDHANGFGIDNRRRNIRIATPSQNQWNRAVQPGARSKFKGVTLASGRWQSRITAHGTQRYLGWFRSEEEAPRCYDLAAIQLHGEFARLNFPHEQRQGA